jgi:hypothetical protein
MNNTFSSSSNNSFSFPSLGSSTSGSGSGSGSIFSSPFSRSSTSTSSSGSGYTFAGIGWLTWLIIILVLAFLGFNIFIYLAKGTQIFANISAYFAGILGTGIAETTKQVVDVSATGTKAAVDITSGTVDSSINLAQQTASEIKNDNYSQQQKLNSSLNQAKKDQIEEENVGYSADESTSAIQSSKPSNKSGWCYIGEDRGFRSCVEVGQNDECMSGDIFSSKEICVNPNLRP